MPRSSANWNHTTLLGLQDPRKLFDLFCLDGGWFLPASSGVHDRDSLKERIWDIEPTKDAKGKKYLNRAQQELAKIQNYRAPRDKVICVLNSCKVLFGYLRSTQAEQSADDFIPLLIYTVLRAAPDHLVSNVEYIQRFRNPDKLSGESGYYMSSLLGAVQFRSRRLTQHGQRTARLLGGRHEG